MNVCKKLWYNAEVNLQGSIQPCSSFNGNLIHESYDLEGYLASAKFRQVLHQQQQGQRNPECEVCWQQEARGETSLRMVAEDSLPKIDSSPRLVSLDYSLDHICNLKCIMCNEQASSSIFIERRSLGWPVIPVKLSDSDQHLKFLADHIQDLEYLNIYNSGEPLLSPRLNTVLDLVMQKNPKLHLMISTNGTAVNEEIINKLAQVKNLTVKISLDGQGLVNEFIRYPSKWQDIEQGVTLLKQLTGAVLKVHATVQALNLWQLDQLLAWCQQQQLEVELSPVIRMPHLSVAVIPPAVRDLYLNKVKSMISDQITRSRANAKCLLAIMHSLTMPNYDRNARQLLASTVNDLCNLRKIRIESYLPQETQMLDLLKI